VFTGLTFALRKTALLGLFLFALPVHAQDACFDIFQSMDKSLIELQQLAHNRLIPPVRLSTDKNGVSTYWFVSRNDKGHRRSVYYQRDANGLIFGQRVEDLTRMAEKYFYDLAAARFKTLTLPILFRARSATPFNLVVMPQIQAKLLGKHDIHVADLPWIFGTMQGAAYEAQDNNLFPEDHTYRIEWTATIYGKARRLRAAVAFLSGGDHRAELLSLYFLDHNDWVADAPD